MYLLFGQVTIPITATRLTGKAKRLKNVRDAGVNAIESLMGRRGAFDYILLETSGLADPGNIAPLFWVDDGLGSSIYLDGIVTLADARNVLRTLDEGDSRDSQDKASKAPSDADLTTAHLQLSHADVIVLNKADLIEDEELARVKHRVQSINSLAGVEVTTYSKVAALQGNILDLHAYDSIGTLRTANTPSNHLDPVSASPCRDSATDVPLHRPARMLKPLVQTISSVSVVLPALQTLQLSKLDWWLQRVLWDGMLPHVQGRKRTETTIKFNVHRLKGRIPLDMGCVKMIQGVREVYEISDVADGNDKSADDKGKIVVIGKHISELPWQESLERSLNDLLP